MELKRTHPELDLKVLIVSVQNHLRIHNIFEDYKPDIVFHAAAHKHVPLMEDSPHDAIKNNVFGTFNFVFLSCTKPIQPHTFPAAFSVNNLGPLSVNSPIIVTFFLISIIRSNISNFCPVEPSFAKEKIIFRQSLIKTFLVKMN